MDDHAREEKHHVAFESVSTVVVCGAGQAGTMTNLRHLPIALLLTVSAATFAPMPALAQAPACGQFAPSGQLPVLLNAKLASRTTLLCNDGYAALASGLTHGALWSAEHPTTASLAAARATPRQGQFHPDDRLPSADQAQIADYRRSGYDRGHMTPSGDMPDEQSQQQTFSLANMVPQTAALNRGIWVGIETAVRRLASREGELYLVTGPAFGGGQLQSIGPSGVLVPSSTWKAVYDPRTGGAGAYVCENTATPACQVVSVATLARVVGIDPFPALPASVKEQAMLLPAPGKSRYAPGQRREPRRRQNGLPEQAPGL